MEIDEKKVDDAALALLYLTFDKDTFRAWKGMDWGVLDRLHVKGFIDDPKNKNKAVVFTQDGARLARDLFEKMFLK